ncbi:hypothetical protein EV175_003918 [Coemansia sp. RSA 1933]|nr:hypothetical protein EV175_003918 [Coemansia sp. RSA 1933]
MGFVSSNRLSTDGLQEIEECREQYLRLLGTLGLVTIGKTSMPKDNKTGFVIVPPAANMNGDNVNMIYASIVAGLNHVLMSSAQDSARFTTGQTTKTKRVEGIGSAIQIVDHERVATRSIDIDLNSVASTSVSAVVSDDAKIERTNTAMIAATISAKRGTSSMTAHTLTKVNLAVLVLFARSLSYWPKAQSLVINRWIEAKCFACTASALMLMRTLLDRILQFRFAFPQNKLPENLEKWQAAIIAVIKNESI